MWVNWLDEGGYNSVHGHGNTVLSGVYYVAGSGPPLAFLDPSPAAHALGIERESGSRSHYTEPAKVGKLLIFPGYVQHYVDPHPGPGSADQRFIQYQPGDEVRDGEARAAVLRRGPGAC